MNYLLVLMVVGNFSVSPTFQLQPFSTLHACQTVGLAWIKSTELTAVEGRVNYTCVPVERARPKSKRKGRPHVQPPWSPSSPLP